MTVAALCRLSVYEFGPDAHVLDTTTCVTSVGAPAKTAVSRLLSAPYPAVRTESSEIVTKSAVRNTLVTPGNAKRPEANSLSVGWEGTNVAGPPTGLPMVNLTALGLGVGSTCMIRLCP